MKRNPYTFRQTSDHARLKAFAEAYVHNGGKVGAAAEAAGYAAKSGSALMKRPDMPKRIADAMRDRLVQVTPELLQVLLNIALDPSMGPKDRLNAANSLLDRGELKRTSNVEHEHKLTDPSALIAEVWERRQARLAGPDAPQVIDAEAEPVDAS
jgi:hypothetical protein